jgi:Baseplate J-like protein
MPLKIPAIDDRRYQELLDEALARIPVHNPEWTNFNKSDPGVTVIEVCAFLAESILYRAKQIPERNRLKFLSLLGVPLQPATPARGLVTFSNDRGPLRTITLNHGLEVRAGQVPFRTEQGLDVLPIEAQAYFKQSIDAAPALIAYYQQLYASMLGSPKTTIPTLYQPTAAPPRPGDPIDLSKTVDGSLWIALLTRTADAPLTDDIKARAREAIGGKTLSLGVVPALTGASAALTPGGAASTEGVATLVFQIPIGGALGADRIPRYRTLDTTDVPTEPAVIEITLPAAADLGLWTNLGPLDSGVGDFPPSIDDTTQADRLLTWIRIRPSAPLRARIAWTGINAAMVTQRARAQNEVLPKGTGEPDQSVSLARSPVLPGSLRLTVTDAGGTSEEWTPIDDLLAAGPEVPVPDLRTPPGAPSKPSPLVKVYQPDYEAGVIRFGDGLHGARPPVGATLRADYDYGAGLAGNVGPGSINAGPALPSGVKVVNPLRTWGGADAEHVAQGEKQIARYVQHRDRLVTAEDFETIALRTPGVSIGRVEVLSAFHPELGPNEPGDAAGVVTLMVIPAYDLVNPAAPVPDQLFIDTICGYLDPRRLVTTEVLLRPPKYRGVWVSIGLDVVAGTSTAEVREAVKAAVTAFLAPLPPDAAALGADQAALLATLRNSGMEKGWPLRKAVIALEILAVASRVPGVLFVKDVWMADEAGTPQTTIPMTGLDLPRLDGLAVVVGDPIPLADLRGQTSPTLTADTVPVPVIPEDC